MNHMEEGKIISLIQRKLQSEIQNRERGGISVIPGMNWHMSRGDVISTISPSM